MDTHTNRILKITLVVIAVGLLSACGATKSFNPGDSTDLGSNVPDTAAKASCSKNVDLGDAKLQVAAYYDSYGQYFANKFRVKMPTIPADWKAQDYDMVVRLMASSASGTLTPGSSLPFTIERPSGGTGYIPATSYSYTIFNVSYDIFGISKFMGLISNTADYLTFNPQIFFNTAHLVVHSTDTVGAFQVLRLEFRVAGGGAVVKYIDTLLPVFHADPKEYAKNHSATLQALHPLKDYASGGYTQDQYKAFSDQWCF